MNTHRTPYAATLVGLALFLPACAGVSQLFIQQSDPGLSKVDELLERVESVHVESVVSRDRMHAALEALQILVGPDFGGDALESFARFEEAVERCGDQAVALADEVDPMQAAAQRVFQDWHVSLAEFSSEELRSQSRVRLNETRERFEVIVRAVVPSQLGFEDLAAVMRDMALFLRHDFTASAVTELRAQVGQLAQRALEVDKGFRDTQQAALAYARSGALRGQVLLSRIESPLIGPQPTPSSAPQPAEDELPTTEPVPSPNDV